MIRSINVKFSFLESTYQDLPGTALSFKICLSLKNSKRGRGSYNRINNHFTECTLKSPYKCMAHVRRFQSLSSTIYGFSDRTLIPFHNDLTPLPYSSPLCERVMISFCDRTVIYFWDRTTGRFSNRPAKRTMGYFT